MDYTKYTTYPITPKSTVYISRLKTHSIFWSGFIYIIMRKQNTYKRTEFVTVKLLHWNSNTKKKRNSNTLATWCGELTHLKSPWCWKRLRARGEGDDRGWDGWMASLTQWTWVWVDSRNWWWTGMACCSSWGCKELDTTERLNWTEQTFIQYFPSCYSVP